MNDLTKRLALATAMVVTILVVDLVFFRQSHWTLERLSANIGIVLCFGALYFRFFTHP